ncbi:acetylornithine deacetylase [Psychrobacter fozii]|uniref:Acetylornithine deacetylase n=1 Tax=Psychrobacter fozii TaxID=198480 RepID=A0A2V4USY7_9GAMM|nr:acetylornithine deacetylase [Psychrobacter fozii]PYE36501.1 acetylornithine deacetylase [Psychrobacter fozii]
MSLIKKDSSIEILKTLIGFDTTSYKSNLSLIEAIKSLFDSYGISVVVDYNEEGNKANLFATTGPVEEHGVLLSGHTDVVPANKDHWESDPFIADERDDKIYGRGSTDMKGFIACVIRIMCQASQQKLTIPLHVCLSFDEEIGCLGVRNILPQLPKLIKTPRFCVIGEPTSMQIALGHKGKAVYQARCSGENGHSSMAPNYRNAIHVATQVVTSLVDSQNELAQSGQRDEEYDIPYTTIHVGKIQGGTALNVVSDSCTIDYEIRHIAEDSIDTITDIINANLQKHSHSQYADIHFMNAYPGLSTSHEHPELQFLKSLLSDDTTVGKISFGTEGGLFSQTFDSPIFVCGPGSMEQGHKPNEYVEISEMNKCDLFLEKLLKQLK